MSGKQGMKHSRHRIDTTRSKAWASMRILRIFTLQVLLTTIPGAESTADYDNLKKWLKQLERHGYVAKQGKPKTWEGEQQIWRLLDGGCPTHPLFCHRCGCKLSARDCVEKETKKEEDKERSAA